MGGLKLVFIKGNSKSVTLLDLDLLHFWLYSNRILTAKILFNILKKWGFSYFSF